MNFQYPFNDLCYIKKISISSNPLHKAHNSNGTEKKEEEKAQFYYIIFYIKPVYLPFPLSIKFQQAKPDKGQT